MEQAPLRLENKLAEAIYPGESVCLERRRPAGSPGGILPAAVHHYFFSLTSSSATASALSFSAVSLAVLSIAASTVS